MEFLSQPSDGECAAKPGMLRKTKFLKIQVLEKEDFGIFENHVAQQTGFESAKPVHLRVLSVHLQVLLAQLQAFWSLGSVFSLGIGFQALYSRAGSSSVTTQYAFWARALISSSPG